MSAFKQYCQGAQLGPESRFLEAPSPHENSYEVLIACLSTANQNARAPAFRRQFAHRALANGRIKRRKKERRKKKRKRGGARDQDLYSTTASQATQQSRQRLALQYFTCFHYQLLQIQNILTKPRPQGLLSPFFIRFFVPLFLQ